MLYDSSFFASTYGTYGSTTLVSERVTLAVPPFKIIEGVIDLDFAALLMRKHLIVDEQTIARTNDISLKSFDRLKSSLNFLVEEGFITPIDYSKKFAEAKKEISEAVEIELREPAKWLPEVRFNNERWMKFQSQLSASLGKYYDPIIIGSSYGALCALKQHGEILNSENILKVEKLVNSKKKRWTTLETDMLRSIVRPYLEEMYFNIVLRERLGSPFLEWEPMSGFYETYYKGKVDKRAEPVLFQQEVAKVEELFSLALPNLRPKSPSYLLRLLKDKNIESFRKRISDAVEAGEKLDESFGRQINFKAISADIDLIGSSWYGAMTSRLSAFSPLSGLVNQGIQEAINYATTKEAKSERKNIAWLYCLVKAESEEIKSKNKILDLK
jgi:hypothetical protein